MNPNYTILYVDDDKDDLMLISEAFEKYTDHLRVVHAFNGVEALQVLRKMYHKSILPCLIILDINMPIMDGKETLREIRKLEAYQHIPVVIFSTSRSPVDKDFAEGFNATFISKPHIYFELEKLVEQFVERCHVEVRNHFLRSSLNDDSTGESPLVL
jgi:CheY-like chemotaxis protein